VVGLALELLEVVDDNVIVENVAARLVERLEELLLEPVQTDLELALGAHEVGPALVHVGPLALEHVVERLRLEAALGDGKVDNRGAAAHVRRELGRGVAREEVETEAVDEIHLVAAELDEHATAGALQLAVEHRVEDRIE